MKRVSEQPALDPTAHDLHWQRGTHADAGHVGSTEWRAVASGLYWQDELTGLPSRALLLDRLQQAMAVTLRERSRLGLVIEGVALPISLCAGVAVFPDDGRDCADLLQRADGAMYRNRARPAQSVESNLKPQGA